MKRVSQSPLALAALAILFAFSATNVATASDPAKAGATGSGNVTPVKMDRLDPAIDKIVPAGATMERVVTGFTWIEGPVWKGGSLFFAEIPSNSIRTWTPGKGVSTFCSRAAIRGRRPTAAQSRDRTA